MTCCLIKLTQQGALLTEDVQVLTIFSVTVGVTMPKTAAKCSSIIYTNNSDYLNYNKQDSPQM
jgi:hypothetical protein